MGALAVLVSVAELMAGVGLVAVSLGAVIVGLGAAANDADEGIRTVCIASATRIRTSGAEGQSARGEEPRETYFDR